MVLCARFAVGLAIFLGAGIWSGSVSAQDLTPRWVDSALKRDAAVYFALLDLDGDGHWTVSEERARLRERFKARDRNRDAGLSAKEYSPALVAERDRDQNGLVTWDEFVAPSVEDYWRHDLNGDRSVSEWEFAQFGINSTHQAQGYGMRAMPVNELRDRFSALSKEERSALIIAMKNPRDVHRIACADKKNAFWREMARWGLARTFPAPDELSDTSVSYILIADKAPEFRRIMWP